MNIVLVSLIGVCLFFSVADALLFELYADAVVNALATVAALITLLIFHKKDNIRVATLAAVFIFAVTLSAFLLIMEHRNYALYWFSLFPLIVYFLLAKRTARIVMVVYGALLLIYVLARYEYWEPAPFNMEAIFNISGATFGLALLVSYFERSRKEVYRILEKKNKELERLAITDHLTGLYNRIKLDEIVSNEISRASRYGNPFSVIMADLDYFKRINDRLGHMAGDGVLTDIGGILAKTCREVDVVGRWGGEEYLVICPETDEKGVRVLAEKLLLNVSAYRYTGGGQITMSIGIAIYRQGDTRDSLLKRADDALYLAKYKGRCRMELL